MPSEPFQPGDVVKYCPKLVSGLNLAVDGLRACTRGALMPPLFCSTEDIARGTVTKQFIVEKRKEYIRMLNDDGSDMDCKRCLMVQPRRYGDIDFSRLGHVDLQHYTHCNLRCTYCAYTRDSKHFAPQYDALGVLRLFSREDVEWDAHVDFAGGEPALLPDLAEYLRFFADRRIRVLMFTNAVAFRQEIYDGLADGSIYWVTTSLDAGTPSTFRALRGSDQYLRVLENLSRYAVAGSRGKGMLAVKYIFCDANCGDDDVAGFAYAMLALRPQKVWLTIDFSPLFLHRFDHDYSPHVDAYAKTYVLLKKHGIEAFHYFREAVGSVSPEGREIAARIAAAIAARSPDGEPGEKDLLFTDFRNPAPAAPDAAPDRFSVAPLRLARAGAAPASWSLAGKRVLLVPACAATAELASNPEVRGAAWVGFVDRNPIQQGKTVAGCRIYSYEAIPSLAADAILVAAPDKHRADILDSVSRVASAGTQLAEFAEEL